MRQGEFPIVTWLKIVHTLPGYLMEQGISELLCIASLKPGNNDLMGDKYMLVDGSLHIVYMDLGSDTFD